MDDLLDNGKPGEIFRGDNNENINNIAPHYIIYLGQDANPSDVFFGAMLTHTSGMGNIPLKESYFIKHDEFGTPYKVIYDNSFIVSELFHKKVEWQPFTKVGELSVEGLQFVMDKIGDKIPKSFKYNK
jgi:hypothetical protein